MRVFGRYLLFQTVGWGLGALLLSGLAYWDVVEPWLAMALLALLLLKDLILFPYVRTAYEPSPSHGGGSLLGAVVRVEQPLCPEGWVRVGAESWRARLIGGSASSQVGDDVKVRDIDSLVLIVEPIESSRSQSGAEPKAAEDGGRV